MKRKKVNYDNVKLVVMNPEAIPAASRRLTEFLYKAYLDRKAAEENNKVV